MSPATLPTTVSAPSISRDAAVRLIAAAREAASEQGLSLAIGVPIVEDQTP